MLLEILQSHADILQFPHSKREIIFRLAEAFDQEDNSTLTLAPHELRQQLGLGSKEQWQSFLNLEPVRTYIKGQMAHLSTVAQRKAFQSLTQKAELGDVQAARQINDLSGIMDQQNNKIVVLHRIDRPE